MAAIFSAVDITTLAGSVTTILVGFVGVTLLFVGFRYVRKSLGR